MKLVINLKLDFQQDDEKTKPTKVVPYVMSNQHLIANERRYSKE